MCSLLSPSSPLFFFLNYVPVRGLGAPTPTRSTTMNQGRANAGLRAIRPSILAPLCEVSHDRPLLGRSKEERSNKVPAHVTGRISGRLAPPPGHANPSLGSLPKGHRAASKHPRQPGPPTPCPALEDKSRSKSPRWGRSRVASEDCFPMPGPGVHDPTDALDCGSGCSTHK